MQTDNAPLSGRLIDVGRIPPFASGYQWKGIRSTDDVELFENLIRSAVYLLFS